MIFTNFVSPLKAMPFFEKKDVHNTNNHKVDIFCYFLLLVGVEHETPERRKGLFFDLKCYRLAS